MKLILRLGKKRRAKWQTIHMSGGVARGLHIGQLIVDISLDDADEEIFWKEKNIRKKTNEHAKNNKSFVL